MDTIIAFHYLKLFIKQDKTPKRRYIATLYVPTVETIDLTDYSLLTNGLVSMLTYFSMSGADKDYIPMFSWTNLFLAVLGLYNKVIFNPIKHKT